ncbi:hypothetical protein ABH945_003758 [Paraburkholderia sp. GAS333]
MENGRYFLWSSPLGRIPLYSEFCGHGAERVVTHDGRGLIREPSHDVGSLSLSLPLAVGHGVGRRQTAFSHDTCPTHRQMCCVLAVSFGFLRFASTSARILSRSAAVSTS